MKYTNSRVHSGVLYSDMSDHLPIFCLTDKQKPYTQTREPLMFKHRPISKTAIRHITSSLWNITGKVRKARVFMGDYIIRKVDNIVNRGDDIIVCLPGAKIEDVAEKAGQVMVGGTGGAVLVHVGTNNAEKEGTSAIVGKYRRLIKTLKEARVGQIVLSGILPIMGGRSEEYKNCRMMAINTQVGGSRLRRHMVKLCGKRCLFHERWTSSDREGCCSSWV